MTLKQRMQEDVDEPNNPFRYLQDSKWGRFAGVFLAVVVDFFSLGMDPCLSGTLIPAVTFGLPFFFGMRRLRDLLITGSVIFIIMCTFLPIYQISTYEVGPTGEASGDLLTNLSASKNAFPAGEDVTFTVMVPVRNGTTPLSNVTIIIESHASLFIPFADPTPGTFNMTPGASHGNLTRYNYTATLGTGLYSYSVVAHYGNRTSNVSSNRYDGVLVYETVPYVVVSGFFYFILYGSLFYILVGITWWLRRMKRMREEGLPVRRSMPRGDFTCSDCGGDVMASESSCPHCGAAFDEDDDED